MKKADVVIGANWGDEGKGLITDFLASQFGENALVVRFCGGAQAGHTVTTPDGKRHVFNHFGSGSLCGSSTYLSRFFICNPILFLSEFQRLQKLGIKPRILIDPAAPITTPYDMMINQMVEQSRGAQRHGSCGMGIGETVERQQHKEYALCFADLYNFPALHAKLDHIRTRWVPARLKKLDIGRITPEWKEHIHSQIVLTRFMQDIDAFLELTRTASVSCMRQARHVIFEGAQGLLLDQDHQWFPHVTRSNTGLKNVVAMARAADIDQLNVHYVTRCYATRHGAGPMPHELPNKPYDKIIDLTNIPNLYQGSLRFGRLDLDLLEKTIDHDLSFGASIPDVRPCLALTCLDQLDDQVHYISKGKECVASANRFIDILASTFSVSVVLAGYGPTRDTVQKIERALPPRDVSLLPLLNYRAETAMHAM